METRPSFLLGDLLVNATVGALVGVVSAALFGSAWNMWLGMFLGMAIGMVLSLAVFAVLFGAMEVMVPAMLTGMMLGMVVGMAGPMMEVSLTDGARWGALLGIACLVVTYAANAVIVRQTACETELQGVKIPEGKLVMLLLGSANHDDAWLPGAEEFDITRELKGHIGFGFGSHFCLGASLARLEAKIALETLFSRCANIRRTTDTTEWIDSLILRGPRSLPLRFDVQ